MQLDPGGDRRAVKVGARWRMGARKAHEDGELTDSEPAGVFARSNSETWPAVLGLVLRRRKATRGVRGGEGQT